MDVVAEIKQRIDPAEYIGRSVKLQKSGRNFRGLCPFHAEKTPSFYVFTDRGSWRCFGSCGEGGDLFSFVQKQDNVDFREALRSLAAEAGVELSARAAEQRTRSEQLSGIVSAAVDFYQQQLAGEDGAAAREYLESKRGLTQETVDQFRLGWAPDEWRVLRDYLHARGYSDGDAVAAGVLLQGEGGGAPYDRFRGRITIPIADERGVFVGLGGRIVGAGEPKYLNSPQTEIFDKGRTLYGLDGAGPHARESGTVVAVEGYLDVIGPWQAGFRNLVATMGTSLTEHHAAMLKRFAPRLVLAMDPDNAGLAAAERAGGLVLGLDSPDAMGASARSAEEITANADLDLRVAPLPDGKDPDDLAREDPEAWRAAIENAPPFARFLLDRLIGEERPDSPLEARRLVDRLRPVLLSVRNPVERSMHIQSIARRLGITETAIAERLRAGARRPQAAALVPIPEPVRSLAEEVLLTTLLHHPSLRAELRHLPADLFGSSLDREIFQRWQHDEVDAGSDEDDPTRARLEQLLGRRAPQLEATEARERAADLMRHILRERLIQRQSAVTEELAAAEKELGTERVQEVAHQAWLGALPSQETLELAETTIEELELGLSIHRQSS